MRDSEKECEFFADTKYSCRSWPYDGISADPEMWCDTCRGRNEVSKHNLIEVRALIAALAEDADNWETMNEELESLDEHQLDRFRRVLDVLLSHTVRVRATKRLHP